MGQQMNLSFGGELIETERLALSPLRESDVDIRYIEWLSDYETTKFLEARFERNTREEIIAFVQRHRSSANSILWAIRIKADSTFIGTIKLSKVNSYHQTAEIGFMLGANSFRRQGLTSEAIEAVTQWSFTKLELKKIYAFCYSRNFPSQSTLLRTGFKAEGELKSHVRGEDGLRESLLVFAKFTESLTN